MKKEHRGIFRRAALVALLVIGGTLAYAEQVTLHYSSYLLDTAQAGKAYYDAIAAFEAANPDIKVEPDFIQNANYTAGIKTRLLGGESIDVFDTWSPSLFAEFGKLGKNVFLDLSGSDFLKEFLPASLKPVTIGGKSDPGLRRPSGPGNSPQVPEKAVSNRSPSQNWGML